MARTGAQAATEDAAWLTAPWESQANWSWSPKDFWSWSPRQNWSEVFAEKGDSVCLSFSPSISTCRGGTLTGLCPHGDGGCISTGAPGPIAMGVGVARCTSRPLVAVGRADGDARGRWQRFAGLQIPRLRRRSTRRPAAGPRAHPSPC
jgi:hypothetical protein